MMLRAVLPFLLAFGLAAPAHAADLGTIGCTVDKLDDATREQIGKDVEAGLSEGGTPPANSAATAALRDAVSACATEHGWPQAALRPAALYARTRVGWPTAQRIAAERGLDPAVLETVWLTLPEEVRNVPLTTETLRELADAAIPEGEQRTQEMGLLVGRFFQFLSVMQYASYDFSQA